MPRIASCTLFGVASVTFGLLAPPSAHAMIAVEPLRSVLRQANSGLRACRERHELDAGRYQVSLAIDPTGKIETVQITAAPAQLPPAAESCLAAVFARLSFEHLSGHVSPAAQQGSVRTGGGRSSRVPPDPRRPRRGSIVIRWPFVFVP